MKAHVLFMSMLVAVMLVACVSVSSQESNSMSETEALLQADRAWSATAEAQDWEAFFAGFADDAVMLAPNAPIANGIKGIRTLLDGLINDPGFTVKWTPTHAFIAESGELGYTFGTDVMTVTGPDGAIVTDKGKYATVWRKDDSGSWKVVLDMFNSAEPMPGGDEEESGE
jgi:ketosteroid isomerase-like protein